MMFGTEEADGKNYEENGHEKINNNLEKGRQKKLTICQRLWGE